MIKHNILITGASSGIGQALYHMFIRDLDTEVCLGISRRGPDIKYDLREPLPTEPFMKDIDLLINCAGVMPLNDDPSFDINFWAVVNMMQLHIPYMSNNGCIINIASVSGMVAEPYLPLYAASKAALISYTKSMAKRLAPSIRVNCISPGFYETNLVPGKTPQEFIDKIPMGYEELPQRLMPVVEMIWDTRYMTGSNIVVDGGVTL